MESSSVAQIITLLTVIAGFWFQIYRENRNRKWDLEDRSAARKRLDDTTTGLAARTEALHADAEVGRRIIAEKIDANTVISQQAFTEANNVNMKIASIGADLLKAEQAKAKVQKKG